MNWTRLHAYCWQSDEGYRVAAARVGKEIRYSAFAPAIDYEIFKNMMRSHYAVGQSVPQQHQPLGCFDDAESARQACARHAQPQTAVMA